MARTYDVVAAGHVCLDITPSFPNDLGSDPARVFVPGTLIDVGRPTLSTGGAVSNTGLALLRMGMKTQCMAKIGDDAFGGVIRDIFAAEGADGGMREVAGEPSSYTCVIAPPGLDRIFFHCPGANDNFGYPPLMRRFYSEPDALGTLLRRVRETGAATSLDMAYPDPASPAGKADWPAILRAALPHVGVFTPSLEELLFMLDRARWRTRRDEAGGGDMAAAIPAGDVRALGETLLQLGAGMALVKCGARGLYLRTGPADAIAALGAAAPAHPDAWADRELWVAPYQAPVVSATGSGDCAIAGFLAGFLTADSPAGALDLGVGAGARNVQTADALSGMIPLAELREYVRSLSDRLPLDLSGETGWREAGPGVWHGPADTA
ncbi:MAG: carbohydrate kinase family protein [Planctomycetota bacterium]